MLTNSTIFNAIEMRPISKHYCLHKNEGEKKTDEKAFIVVTLKDKATKQARFTKFANSSQYQQPTEIREAIVTTAEQLQQFASNKGYNELQMSVNILQADNKEINILSL